MGLSLLNAKTKILVLGLIPLLQPKAIENHLLWDKLHSQEMPWDDAHAECLRKKMRLPTRAELLRVAKAEQSENWLENGVWYWTKDELDNHFFAYIVSMATGESLEAHKDASSYRFRCVIDPSSKKASSKKIQNSEWSGYLGVLDWNAAAGRCKEKQMKLPTIKDLEKAYRTRLARTWFRDSGLGPEMDYWSSDGSGESAFSFDIQQGFRNENPKTAGKSTRCIK